MLVIEKFVQTVTMLLAIFPLWSEAHVAEQHHR